MQVSLTGNVARKLDHSDFKSEFLLVTRFQLEFHWIPYINAGVSRKFKFRRKQGELKNNNIEDQEEEATVSSK